MAEASVPVDLRNPGQILACLGFLEAADVLLGDAEARFEWSGGAQPSFCLRADGHENPFAHVLEFLAEAEIELVIPNGFADAEATSEAVLPDDTSDDAGVSATELQPQLADVYGSESEHRMGRGLSEVFPAKAADRMALPVQIGRAGRPTVTLSHWADRNTGRDSFKLYSGNRSAERIARAMIHGGPRKGVRQLWSEHADELTASPFTLVTPMGGSFNFDPRGAWTAIDIGYSLNDQRHTVAASPIVEFMAAWGLEHARPKELATRRFLYAVWQDWLPPPLARAALVGAIPCLDMKCFQFELDLSGKNKVVTFAELEVAR